MARDVESCFPELFLMGDCWVKLPVKCKVLRKCTVVGHCTMLVPSRETVLKTLEELVC